MTQRAADIVDLENLLNNAGSFDELSGKAIEIAKRLIHEADSVHLVRNPRFKRAIADGLIEQSRDLDCVIDQIKARKHPDALKKYRDFLKHEGLGDI